MDIGTAKIRPEEMEGIPHYLVDVLEPDDPFNVVVFQQMAKAAMKKIRENGHIPIIVGGTGFYIQAILNDIDFKENEDDGYRSHLEAMAASDGGPERLYEMLKEVDRNPQRRSTAITPSASSGHWNIFIRPDRRFLSTMNRNPGKNHPIILRILF